MICSTLELTNYIKKNYISKGKELKGAEFLEEVLFANSEYRNYITLIKARLHHHHIEEMLYLTNDRTGVNRSIKSLLDLLLYIEKQQGPKILVKGDVVEVQQNITSLEPGRSLISKSGRSVGKNVKKPKIGLKHLFLLISIIAVFKIIYTGLRSKEDDILTGNRSFTSVEEIITNDYSIPGYWAVWHKSFEELEAAMNDKESTKTFHPGIKILKLSDERFHLFEFADSKEEAEKMISKRTLRHWPEERVIFVNSEICLIKELKNDPYYICE